jgi:hypothetical protein
LILLLLCWLSYRHLVRIILLVILLLLFYCLYDKRLTIIVNGCCRFYSGIWILIFNILTLISNLVALNLFIIIFMNLIFSLIIKGLLVLKLLVQITILTRILSLIRIADYLIIHLNCTFISTIYIMFCIIVIISFYNLYWLVMLNKLSIICCDILLIIILCISLMLRLRLTIVIFATLCWDLRIQERFGFMTCITNSSRTAWSMCWLIAISMRIWLISRRMIKWHLYISIFMRDQMWLRIFKLICIFLLIRMPCWINLLSYLCCRILDRLGLSLLNCWLLLL